jgi:uncharacterized protein (UPF0335 family)
MTIVAADELRLLVERVEKLEEEKKAIADDVKDVYGEAKARGYDVRTMREIVKLRKLERHVREEREAMLETYKAALGIDYADTPLGSAAVTRAARELKKSCEPFDKVSIKVPGHPPVTIHEREAASG